MTSVFLTLRTVVCFNTISDFSVKVNRRCGGGGQLPLCIKDSYKFQSREDPCSIDLEP